MGHRDRTTPDPHHLTTQPATAHPEHPTWTHRHQPGAHPRPPPPTALTAHESPATNPARWIRAEAPTTPTGEEFLAAANAAQQAETVAAIAEELEDATQNVGRLHHPKAVDYHCDPQVTATRADGQGEVIAISSLLPDGRHALCFEVQGRVKARWSHIDEEVSHLYFDEPMPWKHCVKLLTAFAEVGLISAYTLHEAKRRRATTVALPGLSED